MDKLSKEDFIKRAKDIYGDFFDYNKVKYINIRTKVCIICPKHGEFFVTPSSFLRGAGCNLCKKDKEEEIRLQKEKEFINNAKDLYGDLYDYSKVNYKNLYSKVEIICKVHGSFLQSPYLHLKGHGCRKCAIDNQIKYTKDIFIRESNKIYGADAFDYSELVWKGYTEKVIIICKKCGTKFERLPQNHLRGQMCENCYKKLLSNRKTLTTEDFILKSKAIFGNKFDYGKCQYTGLKKPIILICPVHGEFITVPSIHFHTKFGGCNKCLSQYKNVYSVFNKHDESLVNNLKQDLLSGKTYQELSEKYLVSSHQLGLISRQLGIDKYKKQLKLSTGERITKQVLEEILGIKIDLNISRVYNILGRNSNFVIPDFIFNLKDKKYWIEVNGKQHYFYNSHHYDSIADFEKQKIRDDRVRDYCKNNNIFLIEIPYILNTYEKIKSFLVSIILNNISPSELIDYEALYGDKKKD